jgi:proteasome lid subunit RPN8/RPN11
MAGMSTLRFDQVADATTTGRVYRQTPLPRAPARGHLIVPEAVKLATETALRGFMGSDGRHEGIVFWAGRQVDADQIVVTVMVPRAIHGRGFVHVSADQVGEVAFESRSRHLVVLGQVHSHPGDDTRHSDADDVLVLMAREAMFSVVAARYADRGISPAEGAGIHQFQDGKWVQISDADTALIIPPTGMHT